MASYTYDAWGRPLSIIGDLAFTLGTHNPLRYRGYVYDQETNLYYLQSRYYSPLTGRFLCHDSVYDTDAGLQGYNLFAYCGNNPVNRIDISGADSQAIEDTDLTNDVLDEKENGKSTGTQRTIPTGSDYGGYSISIESNAVDTAKSVYKTADAKSCIRKSTGSYKIQYISGRNYIGKGGFNRAIISATRNATKYGDEVSSIMWKSAPDSRTAFIDEYLMQKEFGGVLSSNKDLLTYNKIWSPGRRYLGD